MDEYNLNGKKFFKTTYSWDAEGNMLTEMQYNHGQSGASGNGNGNGNNKNNSTDTTALSSILEGYSFETPTAALPQIQLPSMEDLLNSSQSVSLPESMAAIEELQDGIVTEESTESTDPTPDAPEAETPAVSAGTEESSSTDTDTDSSNNGSSKNPEGFEWGNGNGEVPPGQNVDENGNITNNGGNTPPGLNRRNKEKPDKDDNPNKPEKPDNPGSEDKSDSSANKAQQGTHIYTYDNLNRMSTSDIAKTKTTYTYDTLGNLVYEKVKNKSVDYQYNELNQLVKRTDSQNQTYTYQYDKRGNRIAETGKKESRAFVYDETNHLVEGTNWKGDKSAYTYNALFVRINNTQTSHSGSVYSRDYVIDYTSLERDDLMIFAEGDGQLDYVQREVYAGSERIEQFTDRSNGGYERTLYVHEDVQGNTRYYTKTNGNSFAELTYDAWGMPVSPNKLLNNDHGNYVYATYTGHIFDTTLDIYFAEARFYDAQTRTWLAMDPIKDGGNWYQYVYSNPIIYFDLDGAMLVATLNVISEMYNTGQLPTDEMTAMVILFNGRNPRLAFHEIAQIVTASQPHELGYETELEYRTSAGEVDVVATGIGSPIYAWEIKVLNDRETQNGVEQLLRYTEAGNLKIRDYPLDDVTDIPIVGKIKMAVTYKEALGIGNYYFYTVDSCQPEHELVYVENEVKQRARKAAIAMGALISATLIGDIITGGAGVVTDIPVATLALELALGIISN